MHEKIANNIVKDCVPTYIYFLQSTIVNLTHAITIIAILTINHKIKRVDSNPTNTAAKHDPVFYFKGLELFAI